MIRLLVPLAGIVRVLPAVAGHRADAATADSRVCSSSATRCCCSSRPRTSTSRSGRSNRWTTARACWRCLLLQMLMCLTMWNSFYSLLWGFSGGLMHDLYNDEELRHVDRLVRSYRARTTAASIAFWRGVFPTSRPADTSSCGRDAAAAMERPRHRPGHARRVQDLFARHGRRRQVAHADQPGSRRCSRLLALQAVLVAVDERVCVRRRISTSRSSSSACSPPRSPCSHDRIAARAGARIGRQVVPRADPPGAGRLPLPLHDAAGSVGDAADSGGGAARARAGAVGGRARPSGTA